ncbi:MAG: response regulator [Desulfamplus sp.]|nr:response regulator [Desulfamplus sp.]
MIQNNKLNNLPETSTHKPSKRYSIAFRLTLSLAIAVAVMSLLSSIMMYFNAKKDMENKLEQEADKSIEFIAGILAFPLWNLDYKNIETIGVTLFQNDLIASLIITKHSRQLIYSLSRKESGERYIKRIREIVYQGKKLGEIQVELTNRENKEYIHQLLWNLGKITIFILLSLLFFTGCFIRRYLKKPLEILNLNIKEYTAGRYNSWKTLPYAEFQNVEHVLVEMENTIQQQMDSLRQSEEKYRVLFESFPLGITITDNEGEILESNAMSKQLIKIPNSNHKRLSIINKEVWTIIRGDGSVMPVDEYPSVRALKENRIIQNVEMGFVKPNKDITWLNVTAAPIPLDKYGAAITYGDITEKKKIQKQLQQAQKMEAIGTLAGGIAHDFNNILFPILGYTEMLLKDISEDSPFRSRLDKIHDAAMRAKSLVNQILTFSRQEKSEPIVMKIQHILKEALSLMRAAIPATIEIRQDIKKECGLIKADPTQIHQIIMNLVTNAYHAMEDNGGVMTVVLKEIELNKQEALQLNIEKGSHACLTVSDTGIGIPEDVIEKIFDPFFTTKTQGRGTGIGLSVVQGIVKNAGGSIHLKSEVGIGTEFNLYFPIVDSRTKEEGKIAKRSSLQGGTENILIVDDEETLIEMQKDMLERLGYKVTACKNSVEALEIFRENPNKFDIVITDFAMPNLSGEKLAIQMLQIRSDIPIVLCTGFSTMSEEKIFSMGIKGLLMKPVDIESFDKKIREILNANRPIQIGLA